MRAARLAVLVLLLPAAGCIFAVDEGGNAGLEKRIRRLEKRVQRVEKERGIAPEPAPAAPADG